MALHCSGYDWRYFNAKLASGPGGMCASSYKKDSKYSVPALPLGALLPWGYSHLEAIGGARLVPRQARRRGAGETRQVRGINGNDCVSEAGRAVCARRCASDAPCGKVHGGVKTLSSMAARGKDKPSADIKQDRHEPGFGEASFSH